jgi:hypothetical protein
MSLSQKYYPEFFEPKPVSPKRPQFIKKKLVIKKRYPIELSIITIPILGKRKLVDAFGLEIYNDIDRYGQEIPPDFFVKNFGHGV